MKSKQSSELFATMTEVLCVAYTHTSAIDTQSARTTPSHLKVYAGLHLRCCVQNAHLNPGTGLAFIRLCKHAHFTITACKHACNSPNRISVVIYLRFSFWRIAVRHPWCCVRNAHLNPGTGLAFRSCE